MSKKKSRLKRRLPLVGIFLLLVAGICFFIYPLVGNWYTDYTSRAVIQKYDQTIQEMGEEAIHKLERQAVEYNRALAEKEFNKVSSVNYDTLLSVADSLGYIEIPKIGVYYPIFHGLSEEVLQKGIGHMEGTSLPIGGDSSHCVLAGHTGLPSSKLFTDLDTLQEGDAFYIHVLDKVLKYQVDNISVVLPSESESVGIVEGEDYVTLLTCTPYGINDHRLLVRGKRVPYETKTMESEKEWPLVNVEARKLPARTIMWYGGTGIIAVVLIVVICILVFPAFKRKKKSVSSVENNSSDDNT